MSRAPSRDVVCGGEAAMAGTFNIPGIELGGNAQTATRLRKGARSQTA